MRPVPPPPLPAGKHPPNHQASISRAKRLPFNPIYPWLIPDPTLAAWLNSFITG
ncbi:MAG TPA: hypothetical protein VGY58_03170 [Gemmataceae bacterium]|jgi:hypothetical protein|nr:hypothetical protein [Gemmataceae bacterium]